jgi:hypothetical protein
VTTDRAELGALHARVTSAEMEIAALREQLEAHRLVIGVLAKAAAEVLEAVSTPTKVSS